MICPWLFLFATLGAGYILAATETKDCVCGQSNSQLGFRIVGGVNTKPHEYPWQVAITTTDGSLYCGGSIISDQHILTAGHCVYYTDPLRLQLVVGAHDLRKKDGHRYRVRQVLLHPEFKAHEDVDVSDAAIIIPAKRIRFSATVRPICLPQSTKANYAGRKATVTGWGHLWTNGPAADILQSAKLMMLTEKQCKSTKIAKWYEPNRMVCAYARHKDSCQGDSGGPLTVQTDLNRWEQIAVVSFGIGCGTPNMPGVYVPVTYLMPWLREVMEGAGVCRDPAQQS